MLKRTIVAASLVALLASGAAFAATRSKGTVVALHKTSLGKVLSTSKGVTLYLYTPDGKNKSNCIGACAATWPPLKTKGKPRAGAGIKAKLLGQTKGHQVTYAGHPLYRYSGDSAAGQTNGENIDGIWFVLSASGKKVAPSQSGGATTGGTTTTTPYHGPGG